MEKTRRTFIKNSAGGALAAGLPFFPVIPTTFEETRFGAAEASFMLRRYRKMNSAKYPDYANALEMIEHFSSLGFSGAQLTMYGLDSKLAKKILKRRRELDFFMEGQIKLPKNRMQNKLKNDLFARAEQNITPNLPR